MSPRSEAGYANKSKKGKWGKHLENLCHTLKGNKLLAAIYVFIALTPCIYTLLSEIPPLESLQVAEGTLSHEKAGRAEYRVVLTNEDGKSSYTCRTIFLASNHDCHPKEKINSLLGKQAKIWWFEQSIYPFITQNRLLKMVVDDQEEVNYEKEFKHNKFAKKISVFFAVIVLIFFSLITHFTKPKSVATKGGVQ